MALTISLNGTQLNNEPRGLKNATQTFVRGEGVQTGFTELVTDVEFWGDGYDILLAAAQLNAPCSRVSVVIGGDIDFVGFIYVGDVEFDTQKKLAKAAIEDDTLAAQIIRNADLKVRFGANKGIGGTSITPYNGASINFGGSLGSRQAFNLKDTINYIMAFLSDGEITPTYDAMLNTNYRPNVYQLTCTRAIGAPVGVVTVLFNDIYGQSQNPNGTIGTLVVTDADYAQRVAEIISGTQLDLAIDGRRPYEVFVTSNIVTIRFFHNASFSVVGTGGTGTIGVSQIQTQTYGAQNVWLTTGEQLAFSNAVIQQTAISLRDLEGILSLYNLRIIYTKSVSTYGAQVITEQNTFDSTTVATLSNVANVTMRYNQPLAVSTLDFSQPNSTTDTEQTYLLVNDAGYSGNVCSDNDLSVRSTAKYAYGLDFNSGSFNFDTKDIWVFESDGTSVNEYPITSYDGVTIAQVGVLYFASGIHPLVARNYTFKNPDGLRFTDGEILPNNAAIKLEKEATFSFPLTKAQRTAIAANPLGCIIFDGNRGYIKELNYNIQTGMTEFNLLVE